MLLLVHLGMWIIYQIINEVSHPIACHPNAWNMLQLFGFGLMFFYHVEHKACRCDRVANQNRHWNYDVE